MYKVLKIPFDWTIIRHEFLDLEPDNDIPIEYIWYYFHEEDVFLARNKEYFIELGYYGIYQRSREGFFKLSVVKDNFKEGILYELFLSRITNEVKEKIELYCQLISSGKIKEIRGKKLNENNRVEEIFEIYSSISGFEKKLTKAELYKYLQSSKGNYEK